VVNAEGDWPAVRQAVLRRMGELGLSVETLAGETGLSQTTVRYFGQAPAHAGTLEAIGVGLGWPPGHLLRILNRESPRPTGAPVAPETPVMARLTQIERKLDALLTQLSR
jgi:cyanate lyase